jgi:predicted phosphodiesterase
MTAFTWLHLSDLHLRRPDNAVSPDREYLRDMLTSIKGLRREEGLAPDVVFFTGDVVFSGQKEEYDLASEWFDNILATCDLDGRRDRLFIVPGNHDVDRREVNRVNVKSWHPDLKKRLLDGEDYDEITKHLSKEKTEERAVVFEKLKNFAEFIGAFYADSLPDVDSKFDHNRYYFVRSIEKEGHTVVVMGFNSAWLSFEDSEQGRLLLGEVQVCNALEEGRERWSNPCLRIALMHHPLYWLAEKDIHRVQHLLARECDVVLRGHLHCPSYSIQSTPDSRFCEFAAGASSRARYHAYNIVQLNLDTGRGKAYVRLQHPELGIHWGKDDFTYGNAIDGRIEFSLRSASGFGLPSNTITEA